jgi:rhodanese-related sulfurtransferase
MPKPATDLMKALVLLAAAAVCAGLANAWARPDRKLGWTGWAPPPADLPAVHLTPPLPPPPAAPAPAPAAPAPAKAAAAPPAKPPASAPAAQFAPSPQEVIREISSAAAWDAFRLKIPFLDARRSDEFAAGHVPGAWSIPIWEADAPARITDFEARANPQPSAPIAIYCSGGDCADSRLLAKRLVDLGYRNLLIYRDGFPDWVRQGRPQEQGARP